MCVGGGVPLSHVDFKKWSCPLSQRKFHVTSVAISPSWENIEVSYKLGVHRAWCVYHADRHWELKILNFV